MSGGVANYETLLNGEYRKTHPEVAEDVDSSPEKSAEIDKLRDVLGKQLEILRRGIDVHAEKCSADMIPLHKHLAGNMHNLNAKCGLYMFSPIQVDMNNWSRNLTNWGSTSEV